MMAGQVACLVHERKTAAEVLRELMEEGTARGALDLQALADANAVRAFKEA